MYVLTKEQLLQDLYKAYADACLHKKCQQYVKRFSRNLDSHLTQLCNELWSRQYRPLPSSCFIITYPKRREVFAAEFRDRIVHHLYYNYTWELFCRTFIQDTYSCVPERGTHYGISRLRRHILQESLNYTRPCYVLKMDIGGYFMHIQRKRLLECCLESLHEMSNHRILARVPVRWCDVLDMDFIEYLTREIVLLDPTDNCRIVGHPSEWDTLPANKSLFKMPEGCGLPIGNLTSQLYSNVYLNVLDQWMKRQMHCKHYGRYVDDFYVVSADRKWLRTLPPKVDEFLREELGLNLQRGKTIISDVRQGVSFVGAFLRPGRSYVDNRSLRNMRKKLGELEANLPDAVHLSYALNSYLGVLGHYNSYRIARKVMIAEHNFSRYGTFTLDMKKFRAFEPLKLPELTNEDLHFDFEKEDWGLDLDIDVDTSDWEEVSWTQLELF